MLEVLWSSLPHQAPEGELELYEAPFCVSHPSVTHIEAPSHKMKFPSKENPYIKVRAMRRQSSGSSSGSARSHPSAPSMDGDQIRHQRHPFPVKQASFQEVDTPNQILPDYLPLTTPITRELRIDLEGLNRQLPGRRHLFGSSNLPDDLESPSGMSNGRGALTEEEDGGASSGCSTSDSEEPSTGECIRKMGRRTRGGISQEKDEKEAEETEGSVDNRTKNPLES